jgi:hypothetical protein
VNRLDWQNRFAISTKRLEAKRNRNKISLENKEKIISSKKLKNRTNLVRDRDRLRASKDNTLKPLRRWNVFSFLPNKNLGFQRRQTRQKRNELWNRVIGQNKKLARFEQGVHAFARSHHAQQVRKIQVRKQQSCQTNT